MLASNWCLLCLEDVDVEANDGNQYTISVKFSRNFPLHHQVLHFILPFLINSIDFMILVPRLHLFLTFDFLSLQKALMKSWSEGIDHFYSLFSKNWLRSFIRFFLHSWNNSYGWCLAHFHLIFVLELCATSPRCDLI